MGRLDSSGSLVGDNQPRYYAYGAERRPSIANLPTRYTYTGQRWDAGSGLMYYGMLLRQPSGALGIANWNHVRTCHEPFAA